MGSIPESSPSIACQAGCTSTVSTQCTWCVPAPPPSLGDQKFSPLLRRVLRLHDLVPCTCFWSSSHDHLFGWPADQLVETHQELRAFTSFLHPLLEGQHLRRFWPCYWRPPAEVSSPGFLAHRPVSFPHLEVPVFPWHGRGLREKSSLKKEPKMS